MAVIKLTEARIKALTLGSGIHRDSEVSGFFVRCHKTTKSYGVQGDVRRNGRLHRTVRVVIDRVDRIGLREARREARRLMSEIQSGRDPTVGPTPSGMTLAELLETYLEDRDLRPPTIRAYRYYTGKYLKPLRSRQVSEISRQEVRDLYDQLRRRHSEIVAASSIRILRALLNEAVRLDETITQNPAAFIRLPSSGRREVDELDFPACWSRTEELSPIRRDIHRFFLLTGARLSSVIQLKREDIDLEAATVTYQHMKTGGPLTLPIGRFVLGMVKERMEDDTFIGSRWLWPSRSKSGHVMDIKEPGLPSAHAYRHHYRTTSVAADVPMAEGSMLVGHKLPGMSSVYIHQHHLIEHLRPHQQMIEDRILSLVQEGSSAGGDML